MRGAKAPTLQKYNVKNLGEVDSLIFSPDGKLFHIKGSGQIKDGHGNVGNDPAKICFTITGKVWTQYSMNWKAMHEFIKFSSNSKFVYWSPSSIDHENQGAIEIQEVGKSDSFYIKHEKGKPRIFITNKPDIIASQASDGLVKFWDVNSGKFVKSIHEQSKVTSVVFLDELCVLYLVSGRKLSSPCHHRDDT